MQKDRAGLKSAGVLTQLEALLLQAIFRKASTCDCRISVAWEFSWAWRALSRLRLAVA